MVHDLLQIELKLLKYTPKIVTEKVLFLDVPVNLGVQIGKGDGNRAR